MVNRLLTGLAVTLIVATATPTAHADLVPWSISTVGGETSVTWKQFGGVEGPQEPGEAYLVLSGIDERTFAGPGFVMLGQTSLRVDREGTATIWPASIGSVYLVLTLTDLRSGEFTKIGADYRLSLYEAVRYPDQPTYYERVLGQNRYHISIHGGDGLHAEVQVSPAAEPNPEPTTLALAGVGCLVGAAVTWARRRRSRSSGGPDSRNDLPVQPA